MKLWFTVLISVTVLATFFKYVLNQKKDNNNNFFMNIFAPSLALGVLMASLTSIVISILNSEI